MFWYFWVYLLVPFAFWARVNTKLIILRPSINITNPVASSGNISYQATTTTTETTNAIFIPYKEELQSLGGILETERMVNENMRDSNQHPVLFSFVSYENFLIKQLKVKNKNFNTGHGIYDFGKSLNQLDFALKKERLLYSCTWHFSPFIKIVASLLNILRPKHVAAFIDNTYCSIMFLEELNSTLRDVYQNNEIHVEAVVLEAGFQNEARSKTYFYDFLVERVSTFLVLLPGDMYDELFMTARFYNLLGSYKIWLIPGFNETKLVQPEKVLTFDLEEKPVEMYDKLDERISILFSVFKDLTTTNDSNSLYKSSKLYAAIFKHAYNDNDNNSDHKSLLQIRYQDRSVRDDRTWKVTSACIHGNHIHLFGDVVDILQLAKVQDINKKMQIVTIFDPPNIFQNDVLLNKHTGDCSDGFKCTYKKIGGKQNTPTVVTCCVGLLPDILRQILRHITLKFDMYLVEDGKYGGYKNGSWNGMVGDVVTGKADMTLAALTVTRERLKIIDFTTPYMSDQMGVITRPQAIETSFLNWGFLAPMTNQLQGYLVLVIMLNVLLLYIFENIIYFYSFHEKGYACKLYYSFLESMTHIVGVTLQRDLGGKHPVKPGARVTCLFFAVGMVIIVSTYTAVLAAQSMQHQEKEPFKGSQDYRFRNPTDEFRFGILRDSSYESFFKHGETDLLKRMHLFMEKYNYGNISQGMDMVRTGKLEASFTDYSVLHYYLSKDSSCQLRLAKDNLYQFSLGFGLQKGSPYKVLLDNAISESISSEIIVELQSKWLDNICQPTFFVTTKIQLSIKTFGGLVLILGVAMLLTLFMLFPETVWAKYFHGNVSEKLLKHLKKKSTTDDHNHDEVVDVSTPCMGRSSTITFNLSVP